MLSVIERISSGEIKVVTNRYQDVVEDAVYVAIKGSNYDGNDFVDLAIQNGAKVIISSKRGLGCAAEVVYSDNPRMDLSILAKARYPGQPGSVVGITGTNGKTSVASFYGQMLQFLGYSAASIGTLGIAIFKPPAYKEARSDYFLESCDISQNTTPDPLMLHRALAGLHAANVEHVAVEVTSIGLAQHRVDSVHFKAAAFTNFTQDHLDYHGDMGAYFRAKELLFSKLLKEDGVAVLCADMPEYGYLKGVCSSKGIRVIDYGLAAKDLIISENFTGGTMFGRVYEIRMQKIQLYNMLCSVGLLIASGVERDIGEILQVIPLITPPIGRLEYVTSYNGGKIYVDYAHTPEALRAVLESFRASLKGGECSKGSRIILVFGCGGERDPGKRHLMGEIATQLADITIVTDDNPRSENRAAIRKQILQGCNLQKVREIEDRSMAIKTAISMLQEFDILIIAGKGHERYQIVGKATMPFSDKEQVILAIS